MSHSSVCQYFLQGRCAYGSSCHFAHPVVMVMNTSCGGGVGGGEQPMPNEAQLQQAYLPYAPVNPENFSGANNNNIHRHQNVAPQVPSGTGAEPSHPGASRSIPVGSAAAATAAGDENRELQVPDDHNGFLSPFLPTFTFHPAYPSPSPCPNPHHRQHQHPVNDGSSSAESGTASRATPPPPPPLQGNSQQQAPSSHLHGQHVQQQPVSQSLQQQQQQQQAGARVCHYSPQGELIMMDHYAFPAGAAPSVMPQVQHNGLVSNTPAGGSRGGGEGTTRRQPPFWQGGDQSAVPAAENYAFIYDQQQQEHYNYLHAMAAQQQNAYSHFESVGVTPSCPAPNSTPALLSATNNLKKRHNERKLGKQPRREEEAAQKAAAGGHQQPCYTPKNQFLYMDEKSQIRPRQRFSTEGERLVFPEPAASRPLGTTPFQPGSVCRERSSRKMASPSLQRLPSSHVEKEMNGVCPYWVGGETVCKGGEKRACRLSHGQTFNTGCFLSRKTPTLREIVALWQTAVLTTRVELLTLAIEWRYRIVLRDYDDTKGKGKVSPEVIASSNRKGKENGTKSDEKVAASRPSGKTTDEHEGGEEVLFLYHSQTECSVRRLTEPLVPAENLLSVLENMEKEVVTPTLLWLVGRESVFWRVVDLFHTNGSCGSRRWDEQLSALRDTKYMECLFGANCGAHGCPCFHSSPTPVGGRREVIEKG